MSFIFIYLTKFLISCIFNLIPFYCLFFNTAYSYSFAAALAVFQMSCYNPLSASSGCHGASCLRYSILVCRFLAGCWCLCWSSLLPFGFRRVGLFLSNEQLGVFASCLVGSTSNDSMTAWVPMIGCGLCPSGVFCWHMGPFGLLIADLASTFLQVRWFWSRSAGNYQARFGLRLALFDIMRN